MSLLWQHKHIRILLLVTIIIIIIIIIVIIIIIIIIRVLLFFSLVLGIVNSKDFKSTNRPPG